jgi:hypothetical protein
MYTILQKKSTFKQICVFMEKIGLAPFLFFCPLNPLTKGHDELPKGNDESPKGHDESPKGNDESPKGHDEVPKGNDESPKGHDESPKGNDESPKGHDESPKGNDESPKGNDEVLAPSIRLRKDEDSNKFRLIKSLKTETIFSQKTNLCRIFLPDPFFVMFLEYPGNLTLAYTYL